MTTDTPAMPSKASVFRRVLQVPELRRVELSWGISKAALWGWVVIMNAIVFSQGGAWAVGVLLAARIIPGAIATPVVSVLADRWGPLQGLAIFACIRTLAMGTAVVAMALGAPVATLVVIAALEGLGSEPFDAVHHRVLPWLARSAEELTAANGLSEVLRMAGILLGPTCATILLLFVDPAIAICACAGVGLWGALLLKGLGDKVPATETSEVGSVLQSLHQGCRNIFGDGDVLILVGVSAWTAMSTAALQVYATGLSMDFLALGNSGPSLLTALFGLGGLVGGMGSLLLAGRRNLVLPLLLGSWVIGVPLILMGLWPYAPMVFSAMALAGIGIVMLLVAGTTLMQRGIPLHLQAAVFGIYALIGNAFLGLGGLLGSTLVATIGLPAAISVTGLSMPVLTLLVLRSLRRFVARSYAYECEVDIVRQSPLFNILPIGPLERVAAALERRDLAVGEIAIRQGDMGQHCFIVSTGKVAVLVDGLQVSELTAGEVFGEIALLKDMPRTATVVARLPSAVYRLERRDFLAALHASPESRQRVDHLVDQRLQQNARLCETGFSQEAG